MAGVSLSRYGFEKWVTTDRILHAYDVNNKAANTNTCTYITNNRIQQVKKKLEENVEKKDIA